VESEKGAGRVSPLDQENVYQERFPVGTTVKIKDREYLQDFLKSWHLHNPLRLEQVDHGGQLDVVKKVGFYHGGDVLYELEHSPGIWHEQYLQIAPREE
jgi:hypothetical protein